VARAFVGLGANLGDPARQVAAALDALGRLPRTRLVRASSLYRSAPVGNEAQPEFVNAVAALQTGLSPRELLEACLGIEHAYGRERSVANAPRTLDLDLLLYDDRVLREPGLEVPHPRMHGRAFVLAPLLEIAPGAIVPGHGRAADLLAGLRHQHVERIGCG